MCACFPEMSEADAITAAVEAGLESIFHELDHDNWFTVGPGRPFGPCGFSKNVTHRFAAAFRVLGLETWRSSYKAGFQARAPLEIPNAEDSSM